MGNHWNSDKTIFSIALECAAQDFQSTAFLVFNHAHVSNGDLVALYNADAAKIAWGTLISSRPLIPSLIWTTLF